MAHNIISWHKDEQITLSRHLNLGKSQKNGSWDSRDLSGSSQG